MSPDRGRLYAQSTDEPPFSNSDQGQSWLDANCSTCLHDKPARQGRDHDGCPLIRLALTGRTPAQWLCPTDRDHIHATYTCTEYRPEDDGPAQPRPHPHPARTTRTHPPPRLPRPPHAHHPAHTRHHERSPPMTGRRTRCN